MSSSQSRHVYTRQERAILEASFARQSHPDIQEKERLAQILNCNLIQISNWFQNHRRRMKKLHKTVVLNTSNTITNESSIYPTSYIYHQSTCPYNTNMNNSSYSYYSYPTQQYVYSQPMFFDPYVTYEQ